MQTLRRLIVEDEAMMVGIKHPQEYNYFRIMRFHMLVINVWPGREIGENLSNFWILITYGHIVLHALFLVGGFIYIKTTPLDFFEVVHVWFVQIMWMLVMTRIILLTFSSSTYKNLFKIFLNKMHLFYYKNVSTYAMKTHKRVHLISHFFTVLIIIQMLSVCIFFQVVPMCKNYFSGKYNQNISNNVTYELAFYYSFPYQRTRNGYIFACILNWFAAYFMAVWFCLLDLMLSLLVFNIWGHLKILIHELESFQLPAKNSHLSKNGKLVVNVEMFSQEELEEVSRKLKQCINYHRQIVEFANLVSNTFGPMLFFYYLFYQASLCLQLLECSQITLEALTSYGLLTFINFQQLIQLSMVVELISTKSEQLKDAVYGIPWEYMDVKNRRIVAIFLMNLHKPIYVKALGLTQVGVTTMATIIKNSLSYFMFLHTISK